MAGVLACFVLSGFAGLLYQTAWAREFAFVFGTSDVAVAVVLAGYMGGLAIGAALAARFVDRLRRPVLAYGLLELGVAVSALLVPFAIRATVAMGSAVFGGLPDPPPANDGWLSVFQLTTALAILIVPTALMGATLPILTRHAVRSDREIGPRVGLLYATNTLGAVAGTVATGFWLLPALGLRATVWVGVAINALVFVLAAWVARTVPAPDAAPPDSSAGHTGGRSSLILPLVMTGGAVSFVYEVLWTRLLGQLLGGTVYSFSTMLATFLVGITVGSMVASPIARSRRAAAIGFVIAQLGVAIGARAAYVYLDRLPDLALAMGGGAAFLPLRDATLSAAMLLPSTLFLGATFPFAVRLLAHDAAAAGAASARVYAWNTVGGVAGALAAGLWLLPTFEFADSMRFASCANAILALAAAVAFVPAAKGLAVAALVAVLAVGAAPIDEPWRLLRVVGLSGQVVDADLAFFRVGRSSTVMLTVAQRGWGLRTNGLPESNILRVELEDGLSGARWLSALPAVLRPDARSLLVVGLGGGVVVESVPDGIERIDVVELEPAVVEANRLVAGRRRLDPLSDPRVRLTTNDVRGALALTDRRWDIVSSQPSHPWTPGASHLFTREFAAVVRDHLEPGGVFLQWIAAPFMDAELFRGLLGSLDDVFEHVAVYVPGGGGSVLMLGSDRPLRAGPDAARAIGAAPDVFARAGLLAFEDAVLGHRLDGDGVAALVDGAVRSTDDYNLMLTRSPRILANPIGARSLNELIEPFDPLFSANFDAAGIDAVYLVRRMLAYGQRERAQRYIREHTDGAEKLVARAYVELARGDDSWAADSFKAALARYPGSYAAAAGLLEMALARSGARAGLSVAAVEALPPAARAVLEGLAHAERGRWAELERLDPLLATHQPRDPLFATALRLRARWRVNSGDTAQAAEAFALLRRVLPLSAKRSVDLILRARTAWSMEDAEQAEVDLARGLVVAAREGLDEHDAAAARALLDRLPIAPEGATKRRLEDLLKRAENPRMLRSRGIGRR